MNSHLHFHGKIKIKFSSVINPTLFRGLPVNFMDSKIKNLSCSLVQCLLTYFHFAYERIAKNDG